MSHTTVIKSVKVTDITALRSAVAELQAQGVNCQLAENTKPRMWYANQGKTCDYVVKLPDCKFDVGFEKQSDGSYAPVFDAHGNWVGQAGLGAVCPMPGSAEGRAQHNIGKLMQGYAKHAAVNKAVEQGYMVEDTTVDADGNVHLTLTGM